MRRSQVYLLVLAGVFLAGIAAGSARIALARLLRSEFQASMFLVSSLTSWFMAARATASLLGGLVGQARPRAWRAILGVPPALMALVVFMISTSSSPLLILALNSAWGFLAGLVWPQAQSVASLAAPGGRSGAGIGGYFAVGGLGISLGQLLYGLLPYSERGVLAFSAAVYLASALPLAAAASRAPHPGSPRMSGRGWTGVVRGLGGLAAWILVAAFTIGYTSGLMREFLYVYLGEVYGLSRGALAGVLSASGVVALAASLAIGAAADKFGVAPSLSASILLGVAGNLLLAAPLGVGGALAGVALATVAVRSSLPLTRNAAAFPREYSLALVGASNTMSSLGMTVGPLVAGRLYDSLHGRIILGIPGEGVPFATAATLLLIVLAAYPLVLRRGPRIKPPASR